MATLNTANADVAGDRRIVLRAGINLGDVMVEGSDLYGDGVNIAARLESLSEPGGLKILDLSISSKGRQETTLWGPI